MTELLITSVREGINFIFARDPLLTMLVFFAIRENARWPGLEAKQLTNSTQPCASLGTTCVHHQDSTEGSDHLMDENQLVKAEPE